MTCHGCTRPIPLARPRKRLWPWSEESRFIVDRLRPSPTVALRRANPQRGPYPTRSPQDLEPVATRDDVDYLVRLDGSPLKPSTAEQLFEVNEDHEAFNVKAPLPVVEVVP